MMNGGGDEMEEDGRIEGGKREAEGDSKEKTVLMWGYLPGVSPQRSPLLSPAAVPMPKSVAGDSWRDVCGGGCGFAMAISGIRLIFFFFFWSISRFLNLCGFRWILFDFHSH